MFLRKQAYLKRRIREERPDALLLVDFAEFNMPLAKFAQRQGVPVVYYIPPKAWAWRAGRAQKLAKWANVVAAIFPFEAEFYRNAGANTEFVGHPLVDFAQTSLSTQAAREHLDLCETEGPVIGLMPGSRRSEIQHIFPDHIGSRCEHRQGLSRCTVDSPVSPRNPTRTHCEVPAGTKGGASTHQNCGRRNISGDASIDPAIGYLRHGDA